MASEVASEVTTEVAETEGSEAWEASIEEALVSRMAGWA